MQIETPDATPATPRPERGKCIRDLIPEALLRLAGEKLTDEERRALKFLEGLEEIISAWNLEVIA